MTDNDGPEHVEHEPTVIYDPTAEPAGVGSGSSVAGAFGWALTVDSGPQAGLTYVLGPGDTLVGRGGDCDIFLGDVTVSRHHAKLFVDETGLRIEDLGSTNGTYVNGVWADSAALDADDQLIIGKFHLIVARGDM